MRPPVHLALVAAALTLGTMANGAEVYRLTPKVAAAARAEGEARALAMLEREDAAAAARRRPRNLFGGLGLGTSASPAQGFAPLGDVGQNGFVYLPGSIGASRYRSN